MDLQKTTEAETQNHPGTKITIYNRTIATYILTATHSIEDRPHDTLITDVFKSLNPNFFLQAGQPLMNISVTN